MVRVKSAVYTRRRKKKIFRLAKGYYSDKGAKWRQVIQQIDRSLHYAYRDRKDRKAEFRKLWIMRINARVRQEGLSYNRFISGLKKQGITINRKMLAYLATHDDATFNKLLDIAKG
ncbi:MAG: 50S ribosomal protein L20 [bacterium]